MRAFVLSACIAIVVLPVARGSVRLDEDPTVEPPPATTSPSSTTAPAAPPAADERVRFTDTFTDNGKGWNLTKANTASTSALITDGALTIRMNEQPPPGLLPLALFPADVPAAASIRIDGAVRWTTPGAPTLICMADPRYEKPGGYVFTITPNGHGVIYERALGSDRLVRIGSSYDDPAKQNETPASFTYDPQRETRMAAECRRTDNAMGLRLSVDDKVIATATDRTPAAPGVFSVAGSLSGAALQTEGFRSCSVEWRDVKVTDLAG